MSPSLNYHGILACIANRNSRVVFNVVKRSVVVVIFSPNQRAMHTTASKRARQFLISTPIWWLGAYMALLKGLKGSTVVQRILLPIKQRKLLV